MSRLLDARDLMVENGRCFSSLEDNGQYCMLGALAEVHGIDQMDAYLDAQDSRHFVLSTNQEAFTAYLEDVEVLSNVIAEQYPELEELPHNRTGITDLIWRFNDGWYDTSTKESYCPTDEEISAVFEKAAVKKAELI